MFGGLGVTKLTTGKPQSNYNKKLCRASESPPLEFNQLLLSSYTNKWCEITHIEFLTKCSKWMARPPCLRQTYCFFFWCLKWGDFQVQFWINCVQMLHSNTWDTVAVWSYAREKLLHSFTHNGGVVTPSVSCYREPPGIVTLHIISVKTFVHLSCPARESSASCQVSLALNYRQERWNKGVKQRCVIEEILVVPPIGVATTN